MWNMQFKLSKCYILSTKRDGDKSLHFYTPCWQVLQSVTNNPYRGVTLADDLSFSTYVRKICAKGSCTLGFLNQNLKNCPQKLRYQDFLLPGIFAPLSESSQWEPSLPGTKIPGNFHSRERIFPGNFVPDIASFLSDHGKGCWHCSESKLKKYGKMNANNIYLYYC